LLEISISKKSFYFPIVPSPVRRGLG
jgi:hypothetical protein